MRKTTFAGIAAGALILAGIAGWANPNNRSLEAKASTSVEAQIDTEEFQDFSLVFSSPAAAGRNSITR
jgi:hypothetical protein